MYLFIKFCHFDIKYGRGCCGCVRMVGGFTTTYAISAYHNQSHEFKPCSLRGLLDTTLCENVCPGTLDSSTNKPDHYDMI